MLWATFRPFWLRWPQPSRSWPRSVPRSRETSSDLDVVVTAVPAQAVSVAFGIARAVRDEWDFRDVMMARPSRRSSSGPNPDGGYCTKWGTTASPKTCRRCLHTADGSRPCQQQESPDYGRTQLLQARQRPEGHRRREGRGVLRPELSGQPIRAQDDARRVWDLAERHAGTRMVSVTRLWHFCTRSRLLRG